MRVHATCLLAAWLVAGCAGSGGDGDERDGGGGFGDAGPGADGTVHGANRRPELQRIGDREVAVGERLEIVLQASDPDGDPLAFNVRSTLPQGAKFDKEQGRFTWTPDEEGTIVLITFEVSDGRLKDQETIQITVVDAGQAGNRPPRIEELGDQSLLAGRPFSLQVVATDPNGDPITYRLEGDPLDGATLDASTGLFRWTPAPSLTGRSFRVEFVASDGQAEARAEVKLVIEGGDNLPPRIVDIDAVEARVGQELRLVVQAEDETPERLVFGVAGSLPDGARFDAGTATFTWTPTADQAGQTYAVVFTASDGEFRAIERVTIHVLPADGPVGCTPDAGEPGPEALVSGRALGNRSVCPAGDEDRYTFEVPAGGAFRVDLSFRHADGDLDLEVTGPGGFRRDARGIGDLESVVAEGVAGGRYEARVYGYDGVTHPNYTIRVDTLDAGAPPQCADDGAEAGAGNDTAATAAPLRDWLGRPLMLCPDDDDFYAVELEAGDDVTFRARFRHADGDLDLELVRPDGVRLWSTTASDDEEIRLAPVPETGRYVLHVYGFAGARNAYTLELDEVAGAPCTPDRVEPNDRRDDAEPFRPELYRNLTWCGDPDWYKTEVPANQDLVVHLSYTGARAPQVEAFTADGARIAHQAYEVAAGEGCQAARDGCRRLVVRPAAPGWVHWSVTQGTVGMAYDVRVGLVARPGGEACDYGEVACGEVFICDYDAGQCVLNDCIADPDACPGGDYLCHQTWCVELCDFDYTCAHPFHTCKMLGDLEMCGLEGDQPVGGDCDDFTWCAGSYDCLRSAFWPGGYCSRSCRQQADCDAGGVCAAFGGGNHCGDECVDDDDCRANYYCTQRNRVGGGTVKVCTPDFPL